MTRRISVWALLLAALVTVTAGGAAVGPATEKASAVAGGGGPPAATGPAATAPPPRLDARAWALLDARSGEVLASHGASRPLPIASATKMMTAYVAMERLPFEMTVAAAPYEAIYGESLLELEPGERISVRDLLYGLILRSGNDAAHVLAVAAAGSDERFVRLMNRHAAALGLADTHFANPVGLDEPGNHSSAYDLAVLGRRLLDLPAFARIAAARTAMLRSLRPPRRIETLNDLLLRAPWTTGIKTGHTFDAGYVLVGSGRLGGVELVSAVLGTPTETARDLETMRLLQYGFSLHRTRTPVRAGQALATPEVRYGDGELALRAPRTVRVGLRRGQRLLVTTTAPQEVEGPIRKGAVLGRARVTIDAIPVASVPLRAARGLVEPSALDRARAHLEDNLLWLVLAISVILLAVVLIRRVIR